MNFRRFGIFLVGLLMVSTVGLGLPGYKVARSATDLIELKNNGKYLVETGESIGTEPAETALSTEYLEILFGDNPELLEELLEVVEKGIRDNPDVNLGEIASIIVTYRRNGADEVQNVVVHIFGEFPLGKRVVNMHPDGYFANRTDDTLHETKKTAVNFVGRDIIVWAKDDTIERPQQAVIEAIFSGEIMLVAQSIEKEPMYFTSVFPNPRQIVPARMRPHIRAILYNGSISPNGGDMEMVALCNSERSAGRMMDMFNDMVDSAKTTLETRFGGQIVETAWSGEQPESWWAYELANTLDQVNINQSESTIRISADFERVVVNAMIKIVERFGRDYSAIRGVQDEKLNPKEVQDFLQGNQYTPRWSEQHVTGPDWPFAPTATSPFDQNKSETGASEN